MARKRSIFLTAVERLLGKQRGKKKLASAIALFILGCFTCIFLLPGLPGASLVAQSLSPSVDCINHLSQVPSSSLDRGRQLYRASQYTEAVGVWRQAIKTTQEPLTIAMLWSNLSLAYQKLGQWQDAKVAIASSFKTLETISDISPAVLKVKAQALNTKGSLEFAIAETENSLNTWQEATSTYAKVGDRDGEVKGLLNQVQALKALGFYRRALKTLEQVDRILKLQPDSITKASSLRSLGDVLQLVGNLDRAEQVLQKSLEIAKQDKSTDIHSETLLSLGNLARLQQNPKGAMEFYQQASTIALGRKAKLQTQLNLFGLLAETNDVATAQPIFPQIQAQLLLLTPSRDTVYAKINFANSLMNFQQRAKVASASSGLLSGIETANIIASAVDQAKSLGDRRAIAYALGTLGKLYEQNQQFPAAQDLTQQALLTAQSIDASDIAYLWQWQLGRLLKAQGNTEAAIAAYTETVNTLQAIRGDLIAINSGLQFSFRESVEPVYRQLVTLLLSDSQNQNATNQQKRLKQAQATLESLQLAELVNFFRADCLTPNAVDIAKVDRSAAVFYPIVLDDSLEVILSTPQQPLQHYSTPISRLQIEDKVGDLRLELRDPSSKDYLVNVQKLYDWLIRPAASQIAQSGVKTIVFVLDGELRDIPMAALHDGQRFLAESYNISLTPGLQLLDPKPLAKDPIAAITAGLSKVGPSFGPLKLSPLPNVERELEQIQAQVPSTVLLNQAFTNANLETAIDTSSFPIVHLATHGKFSSKLEETYLVTWDGKIDIERLNQLLQDRNRKTDKILELLILSACETARGDKRAALGLAGMAVRAGARSTIASLWSVDDEATASFMTALYKNLADKNTNKAEALRQAQIALLGDRQLNHPYFWAPFVLLGNWL
jgi:CHAT domain-containing protein/tetratricopeptide (TPR) repeat protein